ncbi:RING-H2 finger protein ATL43-like [Rosa chinensis]|uniref:RING-H2 finger protein ATL43-like n=1 Tax=Rosa chinensis TaxID=74649 RepID=UPI000D088116|nr:RING-H2 finger protein ATL43-like [Rosa chinensis]
MFLLLLYAKHCKRGSFIVIEGTTDFGPPSGAGLRKNSGIDWAVVEECVDKWLDAHSTCALYRYRVDSEDILLIEDARILHYQNSQPQTPHQNDVVINIETDLGIRRVSGRHSSALEQRPGSSSHDNTSSFRRSLYSWTWFQKKNRTHARRRKPRTSEKRRPPFKPRQNKWRR